MSDYEVVGVINIGGIEFPNTWTADSDTIKVSAGQQDGHHRCG